MNPKINRRQFVAGVAGTLAAIPVIVKADDHGEMPKLATDDAQAAALGYVEDTTIVDGEKYPNHTAEQKCSNCSLYQGEEEWGPCAIFPGKLVAGAGWCAAYAARPS